MRFMIHAKTDERKDGQFIKKKSIVEALKVDLEALKMDLEVKEEKIHACKMLQ